MQSMGIWVVLMIRADCHVLHEERQSSLGRTKKLWTWQRGPIKAGVQGV